MSRRPCSAAKRAQRSVASGGSSTHSQAPKSLIHYIPAVQQTSLEYERPQISHEIILPKYIMDLIWCWAGQRISNHNCIFFTHHRTFLLLFQFQNSSFAIWFFFSPRLCEWLIACFFFLFRCQVFLVSSQEALAEHAHTSNSLFCWRVPCVVRENLITGEVVCLYVREDLNRSENVEGGLWFNLTLKPHKATSTNTISSYLMKYIQKPGAQGKSSF